jgi:hypothetical protein
VLDSSGTGTTSIMILHTSPSACAKATNLSSQMMMALSRLSNSLAQIRSCPCSSAATARERDRALHQPTSKN